MLFTAGLSGAFVDGRTGASTAFVVAVTRAVTVEVSTASRPYALPEQDMSYLGAVVFSLLQSR